MKTYTNDDLPVGMRVYDQSENFLFVEVGILRPVTVVDLEVLLDCGLSSIGASICNTMTGTVIACRKEAV